MDTLTLTLHRRRVHLMLAGTTRHHSPVSDYDDDVIPQSGYRYGSRSAAALHDPLLTTSADKPTPW